jgi:hypothetical protein
LMLVPKGASSALRSIDSRPVRDTSPLQLVGRGTGRRKCSLTDGGPNTEINRLDKTVQLTVVVDCFYLE